MLSDWKHIIIKILCILLFIIFFYKLTDSRWFNTNTNPKPNTNSNLQIEAFADSIENEKINYMKLKETYIVTEPSLDLLYSNYSGEETGNDIWENKTLDQCTDLCSNMEGCAGFTRDLQLDTEPATCYPHNVINKCYSNRKGDTSQMQYAIKHNSFIKSNVPNVLNNCIGDSNLTLYRTIFIKSYSMPNSCLGVSDDSRVSLIENNTSNFKISCNFRIEPGLDGIGTVSFLHIDTGKYLYRDTNNSLILYDISSGQTENKQRASFNLYDSNIDSESVMFRAMKIEGETTDKFISLDRKYLIIKSLPKEIIDNNSKENKPDTSNNYSNYSFYIIDSIINSNIITNKDSLPENTQANTTEINEGFKNLDLESTDKIPIYNNLFATPDNFILNDYLKDNYVKKNPSIYTSISNKYNNILIQNQLSTSLTKNQDEYNSIYNLNLEIEREIANLNMGVNAKNDRLINGLDKMKITDMSNDYFFLKNLDSNK